MRRYRRSMQRRRRLAWRCQRSRGVTGDCGVGVTVQMCNRVTNHRDIGISSRPEPAMLSPHSALVRPPQNFLIYTNLANFLLTSIITQIANLLHKFQQIDQRKKSKSAPKLR